MNDVELRDASRTRRTPSRVDVHITAGFPPLLRVDGDLVPIPGYPDALSEEWVERAAFDLMTRGSAARSSRSAARSTSRTRRRGIGRFRVNVFRQLGSIAIALRFIPDRVYSLEELGAPAIARDLALLPRGLVLLTGPTGSGKSTTLTAMVDIINQLRARAHHHDRRPDRVPPREQALAHPPARGRHRHRARSLRRCAACCARTPTSSSSASCATPSRSSTALSAAETGHLVLSTLHTQGAAKSINRIVDVLPGRPAAADPHAAGRHASGRHQPDADAARADRTAARSRPRCSSTRPPSRT